MSVLKNLKHSLASFKYGIAEAIEATKWTERPQELNIEITSVCDSKCIHCPREAMDRSMKAMDFELFKKIIDEAAELKIPQLCPNGYGEISVLKEKDKYFDYISSKDHKFEIIINTNAFRMTEEVIELYIKHKVSMLNICIDGATPDTAEKIRVNLKLDQIEKNILRLMEIRKERGLDYPKVRAGFVMIPENEHEADAFIEKWKGKVDYVGVDGYSNRAGSLNDKFGPIVANRDNIESCVLPFKSFNVWQNGQVVVCCNDWNAESVMGDLTKQSIKEVWNGPIFRDVRQKHLDGNGQAVKVCKDCNHWTKAGWGVKLKAG